MKEELEKIISNIKSIAWFLANKADIDRNKKLTDREKPLASNIIDLKFSDLEYNLKKLKTYIKPMDKFRKIKICVASSGKLEEERDMIEIYLARKNDDLVDKGIYLSYNVWEKQSLNFNHTYKQEDFNKSLVYDSEIFICLIGEGVGKFTLEEFEEARNRFNLLPRVKPYVIYVYFKAPEAFEDKKVYDYPAWKTRLELKEVIEGEMQQIVGTYRNADDLVGKIDKYIGQDIDRVIAELNALEKA